ncbi:MAG TPA: DUF1294 domain-containing protein [Lachnospiraceae bacterium]|nr:DUF1294 domain-containing protein [Lachnospiraceae bacterium]
MVKYILLYLLIMNLAGFTSMGIDKKRARKQKWRIPERTLFTVAFLGGSIGSILGMRYYRHKTLHKKFTYGMPFILMIQVACSILLVKYL